MPIPYIYSSGQSDQTLLSTTILSNREQYHYQYPFEEMLDKQMGVCFDYFGCRSQSLNQMATVALDLLLDDSIDNMTSYYDNGNIDFNDFNLKVQWKKEDSINVKVNSIEKLQPKFYLD